jgi:tetratricopeptide (TPR) repeat protein
MNTRLIGYQASIKDLSSLLRMCKDQAIHDTLACIKHVVPIAYDQDDIYAETNLQTLDFEDLLTLTRPQDYNLLILSLDTLVAKFPQNEWVYYLRARALWGIEYFAAAFEDLEKARPYATQQLLLHRMRAETLFFLKRYYHALALINMLIEYFPTHSRNYIVRYLVWCGLAEQEDQINQRVIYINAAIADLEKASTISPNNAQKLQLLVEQLKKIR